MSPSHRCLVGA